MMLGLIQPKRKLWISDTFARADSALTAGSAETGQLWTPVSGTWGISGNKLYCVTDANGNMVTLPAISSGDYKFTLVGDHTDLTHVRTEDFMFRYIDNLNYLKLQFYNSRIYLYKIDAGAGTELTSVVYVAPTNVAFDVAVHVRNSIINVDVDGVHMLGHTLSGANATKYHSGYTTIGFSHLVDNGAIASRISNLSVKAA